VTITGSSEHVTFKAYGKVVAPAAATPAPVQSGPLGQR
jgi:hypothetical protein